MSRQETLVNCLRALFTTDLYFLLLPFGVTFPTFTAQAQVDLRYYYVRCHFRQIR